MKKLIKWVIFLISIFVLMGCSEVNTLENNVKVHFVDVGQGDCSIITDNGHCIVIDAGENENGRNVVEYIKGLGIDTIDYVIPTHYHSDHIGGLDEVINSFNVNNVIMPDAVTTTNVFENLLNAVEKSNANVIMPKVGDKYTLGTSEFTILGPEKHSEEMNNNSIAIKFVSGNKSIVMTGDAERNEEYDILNSGIDISADILKIGHHGSKTSTSDEFLNKVNPQYALIGVGAENEYGHPNEAILEKLNKKGINIYRTDLNGTIIADLSSDEISFEMGKEETHKENNKTNSIGNYVINLRNKKVHLSNCSSVSKMSENNKKYYNGNVSELIKGGYDSCGICKPF